MLWPGPAPPSRCTISSTGTREQGQVDRDRTQQGFHNCLRDQTVIRDIQDPNTHATVWNQTAEVWQKAFPDRIEQVPVQQYTRGRDF